MQPLTRRQQDVLSFILDARSGRGSSPTLQELASAFGICIGSVQNHVRALKKKGYLAATRGAHRGMRPGRAVREVGDEGDWRGDFERRFGARLKGESDLDAVFALVRGELKDWLEVDAADLYVYDPARRALRSGAAFGVPAPPGVTSAPIQAEPDSLVGLAARERRPIVAMEGGARANLLDAERRARPGLRACAAVPVLGRDHVRAVLRLDAVRRPDAFDDARMARAGHAAAALAAALEQAVLHAELRDRIRLQAALVALCRSIQGNRDVASVLKDIGAIVRGLTDSPICNIAVRDESDQWWLLMETDVLDDGTPWINDTPRRIDLAAKEALRAIQTQPYYLLHRTPDEVRALEAKGPHVSPGGWGSIGNVKRRSCSLLYVPLRSEGRMLGYISVQCYRYNAYTIRDAEDLLLIGEYIGLIVQNAWRREKERADLESARALLEAHDAAEAELQAAAAAAPPEVRARIETAVARLAAARAGRKPGAEFPAGA